MDKKFKLKILFSIFFVLIGTLSLPSKAYKSWPKHPKGLDKKAYLREYSKAVSIGIETPGSSGSGVIIGKKGLQYLFITAKHVAINQPKQNEEYWVYSAQDKNRKFKVTQFIYPDEFEGYDLALGVFNSRINLPVAYILKRENYNGVRLYDCSQSLGWKDGYEGDLECNADWQFVGKPVLAGVSVPSFSVNSPLFRITTASMLGRVPGNQKGYEAIYEVVSSVPGMSGGGLFAQRTCLPFRSPTLGGPTEFTGFYGGIFAIHGMSEEYAYTQSRSGTGLGIPLDLFSSFFQEISGDYGLVTHHSHSFFNCY